MALYLVTSEKTGSIIVSYPMTLDGWKDATTYACIMAQVPEMYGAIRVEKQTDDNEVTSILRIESVSKGN